MILDWNDLPHAGAVQGVLLRLGLRRTVRAWGFRFQARHPYLSHTALWSLRKGRWERPEAEMALRRIDPERPVVELGGGIGVVACIVNSALKRPRDHVVVEMDERAIDIIRRNSGFNGCTFDVVPGVVSYSSGTPQVVGRQATYRAGQRVGPGGVAGTARQVGLQELADRFGDRQLNLVMDIEGEETSLVAAELPLLLERFPIIVMEVHPHLGVAATISMFDTLRGVGYEIVDEEQGTVVMKRQTRRPTTITRGRGRAMGG